MEVWILVNNRAGRQHARENGEQVRRVFALGGARARVAYTDTVEEGPLFSSRPWRPSRTCWCAAAATAP